MASNLIEVRCCFVLCIAITVLIPRAHLALFDYTSHIRTTQQWIPHPTITSILARRQGRRGLLLHHCRPLPQPTLQRVQRNKVCLHRHVLDSVLGLHFFDDWRAALRVSQRWIEADYAICCSGWSPPQQSRSLPCCASVWHATSVVSVITASRRYCRGRRCS